MLRCHPLLLIIGLFLASPALAGDAAKAAFAAADRADWVTARTQARADGDPALMKLMDWQSFLDVGARADFSDIAGFIADNPHWPEQKRLRVRAEMALKDSGVANADLIRWFGNDDPVTGVGKIALARALSREKPSDDARIRALVKDAWEHGDFDEATEKEILSEFGGMLGEADHIRRTSRLLWDEKLSAAERMFPRVPSARKKLFAARAALIRGNKTANLLVGLVPADLLGDPGLLYDRMEYRARKDDDGGVREILLKVPENAPYPEKWWKHRELQIRKAIDEEEYRLAVKLLENAGDLTGQARAEKTWLMGWIRLTFQRNAKDAFEDFRAMHGNVRFSASRARAAYWAGRAAEALGQASEAQEWYEKAGAYPTFFYGQLAILKRREQAALRLPDPPEISRADLERFERSDLARAVELCLEHSAEDLAGKISAFLIEESDDPAQAAAAARVAAKKGPRHLGVRAAKKAAQRGVILTEIGYPRPKLPEPLAVEPALALAIARQESEFDPRAVSSAGALGLMQLLPRTAKETAKKSGERFSKDRLFEERYNVTLGSRYLARMIESYDGSYVMAIAAYNAGPGNVRKWVRQFGTPGNDPENAITWIEKIPFAETRNYVQRVLENLQVYRAILGEDSPSKLLLADDLAR